MVYSAKVVVGEELGEGGNHGVLCESRRLCSKKRILDSIYHEVVSVVMLIW